MGVYVLFLKNGSSVDTKARNLMEACNNLGVDRHTVVSYTSPDDRSREIIFSK